MKTQVLPPDQEDLHHSQDLLLKVVHLLLDTVLHLVALLLDNTIHHHQALVMEVTQDMDHHQEQLPIQVLLEVMDLLHLEHQDTSLVHLHIMLDLEDLLLPIIKVLVDPLILDLNRDLLLTRPWDIPHKDLHHQVLMDILLHLGQEVHHHLVQEVHLQDMVEHLLLTADHPLTFRSLRTQSVRWRRRECREIQDMLL